MSLKETIYDKAELSRHKKYKRARWLIELGLWEQVLIEYTEQDGFEFKKTNQDIWMLYQHGNRHVTTYVGFIRYV